MPKSRTQEGLLATFKSPVTVEVRAAAFEPLDSVTLLDLSKLKRGNHRVEIGFSGSGRCRSGVRAIIKSGIVTGLEIDPCKGAKAASKQTQDIVKEAYKRIGRTSKPKWRPLPVSEFFASPARMSRIIVSWGGWCIQICWVSPSGLMTCVECCLWPPRCYVTVIDTRPL